MDHTLRTVPILHPPAVVSFRFPQLISNLWFLAGTVRENKGTRTLSLRRDNPPRCVFNSVVDLLGKRV